MASSQSDSFNIDLELVAVPNDRSNAGSNGDTVNVSSGSKRQAVMTDIFPVTKRTRVALTPGPTKTCSDSVADRDESDERDKIADRDRTVSPTTQPGPSDTADCLFIPGTTSELSNKIPSSDTNNLSNACQDAELPDGQAKHSEDSSSVRESEAPKEEPVDADDDDVQIISTVSREKAQEAIPVINLEDSETERVERAKHKTITLEKQNEVIATLRGRVDKLQDKCKEATLLAATRLRQRDDDVVKLETELQLCKQVESHKIPWNAANERQRQSQVKVAVDHMKSILEKDWRKRLNKEKLNNKEKMEQVGEAMRELKEKHRLALQMVREDCDKKMHDLQAKHTAQAKQDRRAERKRKEIHEQQMRDLKAKTKTECSNLRQKVRDTETEQRQATRSLKPAHSAVVADRDQQIAELEEDLRDAEQKIDHLKEAEIARKDKLKAILEKLGESEYDFEMAKQENVRLLDEHKRQELRMETWKGMIKDERDRWDMQQIRFEDGQREIASLRRQLQERQ